MNSVSTSPSLKKDKGISKSEKKGQEVKNYFMLLKQGIKKRNLTFSREPHAIGGVEKVRHSQNLTLLAVWRRRDTLRIGHLSFFLNNLIFIIVITSTMELAGASSLSPVMISTRRKRLTSDSALLKPHDIDGSSVSPLSNIPHYYPLGSLGRVWVPV